MINEETARLANEMNSFDHYVEGSATAEYQSYINRAREIAEKQKAKVDPRYHAKIDALLNKYSCLLAKNMNKHFSIESRVPSILIAGGDGFSARKKEKQNLARKNNFDEWQDIQKLLDQIRSTLVFLKGGFKMEAWELRQMQGLPLEIKIKKTQLRLQEWFDYWGGSVYVSFSGGKDSTVLLHIARSIYPNIKAVFIDTGLEYPEIRSFVSK